MQADGETENVKLAVNGFDIATQHLACGLPGIKGETNSDGFRKGNVSDADSTKNTRSISCEGQTLERHIRIRNDCARHIAKLDMELFG